MPDLHLGRARCDEERGAFRVLQPTVKSVFSSQQFVTFIRLLCFSSLFFFNHHARICGPRRAAKTTRHTCRHPRPVLLSSFLSHRLFPSSFVREKSSDFGSELNESIKFDDGPTVFPRNVSLKQMTWKQKTSFPSGSSPLDHLLPKRTIPKEPSVFDVT